MDIMERGMGERMVSRDRPSGTSGVRNGTSYRRPKPVAVVRL